MSAKIFFKLKFTTESLLSVNCRTQLKSHFFKLEYAYLHNRKFFAVESFIGCVSTLLVHAIATSVSWSSFCGSILTMNFANIPTNDVHVSHPFKAHLSAWVSPFLPSPQRSSHPLPFPPKTLPPPPLPPKDPPTPSPSPQGHSCIFVHIPDCDDAGLLSACVPGWHCQTPDCEPGCQAVHCQPQADQAAMSVCAQPGQVRPELRHQRQGKVPSATRAPWRGLFVSTYSVCSSTCTCPAACSYLPNCLSTCLSVCLLFCSLSISLCVSVT